MNISDSIDEDNTDGDGTIGDKNVSLREKV